LVRWKPRLAPPITEPVNWRQRWRAAGQVWPVVILILFVMGGIYSGLFPPSAAGTAGALGAFVIAVWKKKGLGKWLSPTLQDAASISCVIFIILIGGLLLSRMLVVTGVIDLIVAHVTAIASTPLRFMILASILYLVLGCFIDTTSMMVVTLPFLFPVVVALDIDPIWFGIVLVKLIEISVVTPPVGVNLFAVLGAAGKKTNFKDLIVGVIPFIGFEMIVLAILIAFPDLSTWLPQRMFAR
jgi:tripartite ATP-independent transporter DctM subunit